MIKLFYIYLLGGIFLKYRKFGKTDIDISVLGFGCMRLPILDGDDGKINEEESIKMIRYAVDNGVNYIDTAYPYHKGTSELLVGKALLNGYRDRVYLATKMPVWMIENYEDFDKYLNEQLCKLQTDCIDFYLLHGLSSDRWVKLKELNVFKFLEQAVKDGRIKYIGFSFHDKLDTFKEIVDSYDWTFCQIQYNYMDENYQAGTEGVKYAAEKGLAVVVMEPLRGGKLANNPPESVKVEFDNAEVKRTPAEWALKWVWDKPEVSLLLSGMNSMEQISENLRTTDDSDSNSLSNKELETIERVKELYLSFTKINCTACNYCMPCPEGVNIPRNFSIYNESFMYNDVKSYSLTYNRFFTDKQRASACVECGKCEEACPQQIEIRKHLKSVHELLKA